MVYSCMNGKTFSAILRKFRNEEDTKTQIFVDFKKAYDSIRREVLYNIIIEFGIPL